jgi:hypothetical protein
MAVINQLSPVAPAGHLPEVVGERAARRTLRAQIARLERELSTTIVAAFPHVVVANAAPAVPARSSVRRSHGPQLLSLGDLECVRDDLAERVHRARLVVAGRAELEARSRVLLEEMLREPGRYRDVRLPLADLGEPGCGAYHARPRLGIIGMLMGWWHIKLSSGCPRAVPA